MNGVAIGVILFLLITGWQISRWRRRSIIRKHIIPKIIAQGLVYMRHEPANAWDTGFYEQPSFAYGNSDMARHYYYNFYVQKNDDQVVKVSVKVTTMFLIVWTIEFSAPLNEL